MGKQIILVSGRHVHEIEEYAKELMLSEGDFIISCDGQYIYTHDFKCLWVNKFLKKKDLLWIYNNVAKIFKIITNQSDYRVYYKKKPYNNVDIDNKKCLSFFDLIFFSQKDIEKVIVYIKKENINPLLMANYTVHCYENVVEILNMNVNKFIALEQLCSMAKIESLDSCVYFGDDYNDYECFVNMNNCIAMATAPDALKSRSIFVTKDSDNSGVGFAVDEIMKRE